MIAKESPTTEADTKPSHSRQPLHPNRDLMKHPPCSLRFRG